MMGVGIWVFFYLGILVVIFCLGVVLCVDLMDFGDVVILEFFLSIFYWFFELVLLLLFVVL